MLISGMAKKQKGLSPIGVLFASLFFAAVMLVVFKLGPSYLDYYMLRKVFDEAATSPDIKTKSIEKIQGELYKKLMINNFRDFDLRRDGYIGVEEDVLLIQFEYEVRMPILGNLEALMTFSHSVEVDRTE